MPPWRKVESSLENRGEDDIQPMVLEFHHTWYLIPAWDFIITAVENDNSFFFSLDLVLFVSLLFYSFSMQILEPTQWILLCQFSLNLVFSTLSHMHINYHVFGTCDLCLLNKYSAWKWCTIVWLSEAFLLFFVV